MAQEQKSGIKLETALAKSTHSAFKARCKKLNVSMAQRLRDLVQRDLKPRN